MKDEKMRSPIVRHRDLPDLNWLVRQSWQRRRRRASATPPSRRGPSAEPLESRLLFATGDLELGFSGDGINTTAIGARAEGHGIAVQPNGKVVVAGYGTSPSGLTTDAVLLRYNADGTHDSTFGNGGVARVDFGGNEVFFDLVQLPDGKLLAGGRQLDGKWMLARFTASGQRDANSGFGGTDGVAVGDGSITDLAFHNNQIFTIGATAGGQQVVRRHSGSSGSIDTGYGTSGQVFVDAVAPLDEVGLRDVAVQPDGKVVVAAVAAGQPDTGTDDGADRVFAVARFHTNGSIDANFGIGGAVIKGFDAEASVPTSIAVRQTDGLIAVAGTDGGPDADVLVLNPDGTEARAANGRGFAGGGPPAPAFDPPDPNHVLWDHRGRLVVVGTAEDESGDVNDVYVTRYTAEGLLDTAFSGDGFTTFRAPGSAFNSGHAAALGGNGNLLITGVTVPMVDGPAPRHIITARVVNNDVPNTPTPLAPSIAIESGVLVARGTGGNDVITVRRTGTDDVIVTAGTVPTAGTLTRQFDMDNFSSIRLEGLAGMDLFRLIHPVTTSTLFRTTTVIGGVGIDTVDYSSRTEQLTFEGLRPAGAVPFPHVTVTSGSRVDRLGDDVEQIRGSSGTDVFAVNDAGGIGSGVAKVLSGGAGNDFLQHGDGPQHTLAGGAGNDTFRVEGGVPWVEAGAGNDNVRLVGDAGTADFNGGVGIDALDVSDSTRNDHDLEDEPGVENVVGIGRLVLMNIGGNTRNNLITTAGGSAGPGGQFLVRVRAESGDDTIIGGTGNDELFGAEGNDSLVGNAGNDTLDGGDGTDTLDGGGGTNLLLNGEVATGGAPVSIVITNRILTATATSLSDVITLSRTGADDVIVRINSTQRQFDMDNFDGVLILAGAGEDDVDILDAVVAGSLSRKVTIEGGAGNDEIDGSAGEEIMRGGDGVDQLEAFEGNDALFGQAGNDNLIGGDGRDFFDGGDNDDFLFSDDDQLDTVLGGNGNDIAFADSLDEVSGVETVN